MQSVRATTVPSARDSGTVASDGPFFSSPRYSTLSHAYSRRRVILLVDKTMCVKLTFRITKAP
ncbi:uncharacterized protein PHACADRAFT_255228 [Phanerochaete carnosa HHB-10118-sp]|uniref:Uncharacterized protein n=1 Tax=Phanerochaete carnosa (strain HHB-10118-sp) TaxID=650164 RepID=K5WWX2_PHACS|nr:uncharacterized protein PHACADRAFT_255228 [Phanerochaete carnosa HHB-10118-sp]EKM54967.1 hypothetical protein PHACADRAFT_255228 [Phanerochaete carnosa HHB-10118-sp]